MNTRTLRFRKIDEGDFENLRKGIKSIETRAASERYRLIKKGNVLVFVCGKEKKFSKVVTKRFHFKSVDAMLKKIPFRKIMPDLKSKDEVKERYYSYPKYKEKIKKFGILAFTLK